MAWARITARFDVCTGRDVSLEFHNDAADLGAADHHVEEDLGIGRVDLERRRVAALDRPGGQLGAGEGIAHVVACVCDGGLKCVCLAQIISWACHRSVLRLWQKALRLASVLQDASVGVHSITAFGVRTTWGWAQ